MYAHVHLSVFVTDVRERGSAVELQYVLDSKHSRGHIINIFACLCFCACVCVSRLCVAALSVNSFCGSREALYGVFDGEKNVEVPYLLQCTMNDVLAEELHKTKSEEEHMTNTFLVMQRYVWNTQRERDIHLHI